MIIKEVVHSILHYKISAGHQNKKRSLQCKIISLMYQYYVSCSA